MTFLTRFFGTLLLVLLLLSPSHPLAAQTVPPPPRLDRFGVYNWGVDYAGYPGGSLDRLNWAADKVATLGSRTIRVAMPGDVYLVNTPGVTDLAQIAASPAYDKLFTDARFQTYLLTAYSASDMQSQWSDGFTMAEAQATRDEFMRLGEYLLRQSRWAGKTFIILNWEGDNAMEAFANKASIWDAYIAWIQARADGLKAARQRYPNSEVKLFSGLEFNLLRTRQGVACGTPNTDRLQHEPLKNRCVIDYVAPRVDVDYYSYSAWQTVLGAVQQENSLKDALREDLTVALNHVRTRRPTIQERNFLLGEYGFPRTYWGEIAAANLVSEMFDAIESPNAFAVSYAIFWQIIDNAPSYLGYGDGFGLYRSRYGRFDLTRAGQVFRTRLAGQTVAPLVPRPLIRITANEIRSPGEAGQSVNRLLDSKRHFLVSAPVASITLQTPAVQNEADSEKKVLIDALHTEARFSPRDNAVRLEQGVRQFSLPRDFGVSFLESEMQITVGLPSTVRHGSALLYVTDREGVESNAQPINIACANCPLITAAEETKGVGELLAGGVVTLTGNGFSATGNTVVIEQQSAQGVPQRLVVTPDDVWREAPNRITFRLPTSLLPQKLAVVTVLNAQALTSNEFVVWITRDCNACAPALQLSQAMLNHSNQREQFYPGAPITIRGQRFSATGNRVILEQGAQRIVLTSGKGWSENTAQIQTELPGTLSPGYALFYIVDAQGRESRAQSILITRPPTQRQITDR